MNRFEQRLEKRLQNEEVAASYREMAAELELMHAIDAVRKESTSDNHHAPKQSIVEVKNTAQNARYLSAI